MKNRLYAILFCLSALFPSSPLFAGWSSVSGTPANWLAAGSGSALYAADSSTVRASSDSGKTWATVTGPSGSPYTALAFFNGKMWIGTQNQGAAFSSNQGASWTASTKNLVVLGSARQINALAPLPGSTTGLVAALSQGAVYSSDGGGSWLYPAQGLPVTSSCLLGSCPKQPIYTLAGVTGAILAGTEVGVYRSSDGGANWTASGLSGSKITALSANGSTVYALAAGSLYKSTDGGANWTQLTGLSATPSTLLAHPGKAGVVFAGTAQGQVYSSTDSGVIWTVISDAPLSGQVYALAVPPDQADTLMAATSSGLFLYDGAAVVAPTPKFSFTIPPITRAPLNTTLVSEVVTVTGLAKAEPISIVGGKYSLNGRPFTDQPGLVANGARLRVQLQSSAASKTSTTATVTIDSVSADFVVTTIEITRPKDLTEVFTTAPVGAQIRSDGSVLISSTTPVALQPTLPAGIVIETTAGTPLTQNAGALTFTPQGSGAILTSTPVTTTTTGLQITSGTYDIQSTTGGNTIPVGSGASRLTTDTGATSFTVSNSGSQTSAFVQSGVVYYQASVSTTSAKFAATSGTAVYGGETAEVGNSGDLTRIRIGSLVGDKGLPGDPLTLANVTSDSTVPKLDGNLQRLSNSATLLTVIQEALNGKFGVTSGVADYDKTNGVVTYTVGGKVYRFIPIDVPTVQIGGSVASTFAAANPATSASGAFSLASRSIQLSLASSLGYFSDLDTAVKIVDPNAKIRIRSSGALQITLNGADYTGVPGSNAIGGGALQSPGFQLGSDGYYAFLDSTGAVQALYPAFADLTVGEQTVKAIDPNGTVSYNGDGTTAMVVLNTPYTLKPGYALIPLPAAHANDLYWVDGVTVYLRYPDDTAQGFTL
ncbi:MAG: hypothetical protein WC091_14955 [Sulfuricellaceae bacterium]